MRQRLAPGGQDGSQRLAPLKLKRSIRTATRRRSNCALSVKGQEIKKTLREERIISSYMAFDNISLAWQGFSNCYPSDKSCCSTERLAAHEADQRSRPDQARQKGA